MNLAEEGGLKGPNQGKRKATRGTNLAVWFCKKRDHCGKMLGSGIGTFTVVAGNLVTWRGGGDKFGDLSGNRRERGCFALHEWNLQSFRTNC